MIKSNINYSTDRKQSEYQTICDRFSTHSLQHSIQQQKQIYVLKINSYEIYIIVDILEHEFWLDRKQFHAIVLQKDNQSAF
jgi:hypothetical protein